MKCSSIIAAMAILVAVPTAAYAQAQGVTGATDGRQSTSMVENKGHPVGESTVLVPVAAFDMGFDSNVYYSDTNAVAAALMRVTATFELMSQSHSDSQLGVAAPDPGTPSTGEGQTVDFKAGLSLAGTQYLDQNPNVRRQSNLGITAHADVVAFPHAKTTFFASDNFVRDTRPQDFLDGSLDRDINYLKLGFRHKPGTGAIRLGLRYENRLDLFESSGVPFADRIQHSLAAKAEWQFLPITKFYLEAKGGLYSQLGGNASTAPKASSVPVRLRLGGASAITENTTVRTHVGFGKGFYASGPDFMNVLFGAEFGWRYSPVGRFTVGYRYDFFDAVNANFYRDHSVVVKVDQQLGRIVLGASVNARLRGYRGVPMQLGDSTSRDDVILTASLRGNYMIRDWLAAVALASLVTDQTDYRYNTADGLITPSYSRFEATLGVRAAY